MGSAHLIFKKRQLFRLHQLALRVLLYVSRLIKYPYPTELIVTFEALIPDENHQILKNHLILKTTCPLVRPLADEKPEPLIQYLKHR